MSASISCRLSDIETKKILALQILLNCLKDRRQIDVLLSFERGLSAAGEKVLASGFFCQVTEALCWLTYGQSAITWFEKRQVNHVKRNMFLQCCLDDLPGFNRAGVVESIADQNDNASLRSIAGEGIKRVDSHLRAIEDRRVLITNRKIECRACRFCISAEWRDQQRPFGKAQNGDS